MLARLCSKSFKLGFSSTWTKNFQMHKLGFKEAEEPEIKLPTFIESQRKQGNSRETSTSASLTMLKPLAVWITKICGKFLEGWEDQTTLPISWETCIQVKKQQLEQEVDQCTGSKLGKAYVKAIYCYPAYLTYMEYIMWKVRLGKSQVWSRYANNTTLMEEKEPLDESKSGEWKSWFETEHKKQ